MFDYLVLLIASIFSMYGNVLTRLYRWKSIAAGPSNRSALLPEFCFVQENLCCIG